MEEKDKSFWEQLVIRGLNTVIVNSFNSKEYEELAQIIYQKHIDILETRLDLVDPSIQLKIVDSISRKEPDSLKKPFWIDYVNRALEIFSDATDQYVFDHGTL